MVEGKKLGLVGRCLLGAGLALGCASCENMTESDMFALGLSGYGVNAETPQQAQSAYVLSEFARESGRRQHEIDVAREGKTEVNVNVYDNSSGQVSVENKEMNPEQREKYWKEKQRAKKRQEIWEKYRELTPEQREKFKENLKNSEK